MLGCHLFVRRLIHAASITFATAIVLGTSAIANEPADSNSTVDMDFFESKVRPLLIERCYDCHSVEAGESMGEVRFDSAAAMLAGGSRGPSIVPGDAEASLLVRAIGYEEPGMEMPPDGKLSDEEISILKVWINGGAPDPRQSDAMDNDPPSPLERDIQSHWAFVPPTRARFDRPSRSDSQDVIDDWSAMRASDRSIEINPPADRDTLLRRLHFDLTGLAPTRDELESYANDGRPDALQRRQNRLLADPRYSERFGRHWMDVARYADTLGYTLAGKDRNLKGSHRYRDWVLKAFSRDMPYDEMIRHQLAGDRTDPDNVDGNADAMGFLTVGRHFLSGDDTIDDRIDVVSRGLLGLTVACARCHDHKFDPIPTVDYYSLYNVMNNSVPPSDLDAAASPLMLVDRDKLRGMNVFVRGQRGNRGDPAPRQYLTAFRVNEEPEFETGSGRLDLAGRIASSDNPLTARVYVNRVWDHLIGRPLVASTSDFGFRTPPPVIPEVLDELAAEFATHWSTQRLIRRIVGTRIYQQSSFASDAAQLVDPDNTMLARAERRRRDFESLRDCILIGSNHLHEVRGGESVEITGQTIAPRRTLYARVDRQNLPGLFRTFDFASPDMHSPGRYATTVPQQALFLLNHPQVAAASAAAADAVRTETPNEDAASEAKALFVRLLQREPTKDELAAATDFLRTRAAESPAMLDPRSLWQYGTGRWAENELANFQSFALFAKGQWQVEDTFPSPGPLSYASLTSEGGHPAHGDDGSVVRRWRSPVDGKVKVTGMVGHRNEQGDGVRAILRIGGKIVFDETQFKNNRPLPAIKRSIKAGDWVEFIVHSGPTLGFDGYFWRAQISVKGDDGTNIEADSVDDFSGPYDSSAAVTLDRLAQLAQVLFLTDEFAFVD